MIKGYQFFVFFKNPYTLSSDVYRLLGDICDGRIEVSSPFEKGCKMEAKNEKTTTKKQKGIKKKETFWNILEKRSKTLDWKIQSRWPPWKVTVKAVRRVNSHRQITFFLKIIKYLKIYLHITLEIR